MTARSTGRIASASMPILALALALAPAPARANDSEAEWALGGLVLKQNDAISMDKEDLYISATEVKVDYTYTNHSDADQKVLVSFPLPALPGSADFVEFGAFPDWQALDFHTTSRAERSTGRWRNGRWSGSAT